MVRLLAPQFEFVAHAQQHRLAVDAHRAAVAGRNGNAPIAIQFDRDGGADQLELQAAVGPTGLGQGIDRVAYPLPLLAGVQVQRPGLEGVVGDDQAVAALARDLVAVGRGNGQPSLVVHSDGGLALEHLVATLSLPKPIQPQKTTNNPVFPREPTLGFTNRVVNRICRKESPAASMACGNVHSQVQGLSTSRCFVSNFEIAS